MAPSSSQSGASLHHPDVSSSLEPLRVLIVEDRETDAELIVRELKKHGFEPQWTRVDDEAAFLAELTKRYDLVTADAIMPQFSALRTIELIQERHLDTPCIVISGSIGEEDAVALIRAGAADYLMKDRLGRLGQAIRHVREQHTLRAEHRRAHEALVSLNTQLERRIAERTAELQELNKNLAHELTERRRVEELLREHEASLERRVALRTEQLSRSHARLRHLSSQLTLVEHQERKRLAADLHDYLAQLLVVAQLKTAQLKQLGTLPDSARSSLHEIERALDQSMTYTRTLVSQLSPGVLARQGLAAALKELSDQMRLRGLEVAFQSNAPSLSLSEQQAVLLYQSVRELLINVSKHAQASCAAIKLEYGPDKGLSISVSDNGIGFSADAVLEGSPGFGLLSVRERLESLKGRFEVSTGPGSGTHIVLALPADVVTNDSTHTANVDAVSSVPPNSEPARNYRVLIADDHELMRREIGEVLRRIPNLNVVGEAKDGQQAVSMAGELRPDLILMDIQMPVMDGVGATKIIRERHPDIHIIGMSVHKDQALHQSMRDAGAVTTLVKDCLTSELGEAITHLFVGLQKTAHRP